MWVKKTYFAFIDIHRRVRFNQCFYQVQDPNPHFPLCSNPDPNFYSKAQIWIQTAYLTPLPLLHTKNREHKFYPPPPYSL